jgi:hypothetical protein
LHYHWASQYPVMYSQSSGPPRRIEPPGRRLDCNAKQTARWQIPTGSVKYQREHERPMTREADRAQLIKKHLLVKESEVFEGLLDRAKRYVKIDENGTVHIVGSKARLSARQLILLHLIGRKLANMAGLTPADALSVSELSTAVGSDSYVVSARLTELRSAGDVEPVKRGSWRVVYARFDEIFDGLESGRPRAVTE